MTVEAGLLQAICEAPDDDTPRLIYADWLTDHGQPDRAEFIRAQIELANLPEKRTKKRRKELVRRIGALWQQHGVSWAERPSGGSAELRCWERGFCSTYEATAIADLLRDLPRRVTEAPIQHISLANPVRDDLVALVELPCLAQMRSLGLYSTAGFPYPPVLVNADVPLLTECPYLERLEHLNLRQQGIGVEGIGLLANAPLLPRLCELDLADNSCGDEGLDRIARSPLAARLRLLRVGGSLMFTPTTAAGAHTLATTPALSRLRVLDLNKTGVGDAGAQSLAGAAHFRDLRELYLHGCGLTDSGVIALANSPYLANLEILDISRHRDVGHDAVVALVESPYLRRLELLDLWRCEGLTPEDHQLLFKRFGSRVNVLCD
jgi:uncharacterized protein (TIGR02996 family)